MILMTVIIQICRKLFFEQKRWYERKAKLENNVNEYAIRQAKKTFKKWFDTHDAYILDDGKNSSPRYRIVLRNGSHTLFEVDDVHHIAWWNIEDLRTYKLCKYSEWVKIEKTNMWYRADLVELLDEKDIKTSNYYDKEDDGEIDIEAMKEKANKLEDMQMDSSVAEGGG